MKKNCMGFPLNIIKRKRKIIYNYSKRETENGNILKLMIVLIKKKHLENFFVCLDPFFLYFLQKLLENLNKNIFNLSYF